MGALDGTARGNYILAWLQRVIQRRGGVLHQLLAGSMGCTLHEEKADAVVSEDTLEHWESLLVVTAGDAEAVALELSAEDVSCDLLSNTLVVEVTTVQ